MPKDLAKQSVFSLSFNATDLDTDDEREWDQIFDAVEAKMREAKDEILRGSAPTAKLTVTVVAPHRR